jgi:hypothetical protein
MVVSFAAPDNIMQVTQLSKSIFEDFLWDILSEVVLQPDVEDSQICLHEFTSRYSCLQPLGENLENLGAREVPVLCGWSLVLSVYKLLD